MNWCAWLGHVQCAHRMKEKAMGKQAGAGKIERRKDGRGWAASGPTREGGEKRTGREPRVGPEWKKGNFFKNKTFSKSIFSIFNSKPNSNKI